MIELCFICLFDKLILADDSEVVDIKLWLVEYQ